MVSNNGGEQGGGGASTGGIKTGPGKLGLWIAIGLGALVAVGAVLRFVVFKG